MIESRKEEIWNCLVWLMSKTGYSPEEIAVMLELSVQEVEAAITAAGGRAHNARSQGWQTSVTVLPPMT